MNAPTNSAPRVLKGNCQALLVYDIGYAIDLDRCGRLLKEAATRLRIQRTRRAPRYFDFAPTPLRITEGIQPIPLEGFETAAVAEVTLYDFGAVSLSYQIPLSGTLGDVLRLSDVLDASESLFKDSRTRIEALLAAIRPAVERPNLADHVEEYVTYAIESFDEPLTPAALMEQHGVLLAKVLRSEGEELSSEEIADALSVRISFSTSDLALIDWDGALLIGAEMGDVRAVIEFANVQLLEMRFLDDQLDRALERSHDALTASKRLRSMLPGRRAADLRKVAELQLDGAVLYERVHNALKLLGDQYLARVHRTTSLRLHLADWNTAILRKLETLDGIYQKLSDQATGRRMELLEWIIIVLIAISILLPFLPGMPGH